MSLQVENLQCTRGDRRLFHDLNFELSAGELLHLHGHNGSGKTTLMRAVCGLFLPTDGAILWQGANIQKLDDEYRREVLYVGHKNGIKDDLTGVENLRISCALDGFSVTEKQAWDALETFGLNGYEDLPAQVLSQGQKRRVSLARLLLNPRPLWILDEPFTALDVAATEMLQDIIRNHIDNAGMVILTTHQPVALTQGQSKSLELGWKASGHV